MNPILFKKNKNELKKFRLLMFLSLFFIFIFSLYEIYIYSNYSKKELNSYALLNSFNIEKLYSSTNKKSTPNELNQDNSISIIGIIEIPKIDIKYPILSDINDEALKISPCRFYGPYPNKIGNLCIAGHNYDNNRFFSNLKKLEIGDVINIYDSNNFCIVYYIYNKFEIFDSDTSCTNQITNDKREITLVTCNNLNKKRLILKAKEQ